MYCPSSDPPALWMISLVPIVLVYTLMLEEEFTGSGLPSLYHWRDWMYDAAVRDDMFTPRTMVSP